MTNADQERPSSLYARVVLTIVALVLAFFFLSSPWNVVVVVVAATVDIVETFVFLWWSQRRRSAVGVETLVGESAVVVTRVAPTGQVRLRGELWDARSPVVVERGDEVVVRSVDGLVLDVEPKAAA